jgi:hypothetical protein
MAPRRVVAPKDVPKQTNSMVFELKGKVVFEKTVSIQVKHGENIHILDPKFPLKNLVRFSSKIDELVRHDGPISTFTFPAPTDIPYDSIPYHRVIDAVRATTDLSRNSKRKEIKLQVRGLSLSQIVLVHWITQFLDLAHPLNQVWLKDHIIKQFPKDQGVAQLDVNALRTILRLYNAKGEVYPLAIDYMEDKVSNNLLSSEELEKLAVLRKDFPGLASRLGGPIVPAPTNGASAASWRVKESAFPPINGRRRK